MTVYQVSSWPATDARPENAVITADMISAVATHAVRPKLDGHMKPIGVW